MANKLYTDKFKQEAVNQIIKNWYPIKDTAQRLGVHSDSLKAGYYAWNKQPESKRDSDNKVVLQHIKEAYEHSKTLWCRRKAEKTSLQTREKTFGAS